MCVRGAILSAWYCTLTCARSFLQPPKAGRVTPGSPKFNVTLAMTVALDSVGHF